MSSTQTLIALGVLAASGAVLAPSLDFSTTEPIHPTTVHPVTPHTPTQTPSGVTVNLGLDRTAVAAHRTEERFLQFDITMPERANDQRRPLDLTVVIDTSGSMSGDRIHSARQAAHHLVDQLQADDRFSLVTFNNGAYPRIHGVSGAQREQLHQAINAIKSQGGTNLYAGLAKGLETLDADGRIPRMIVLSDGLTNEGITDPGAMSRLVASAFERGTGTSTVGLGLGFNEDLLFAISKAGGGSFDFVNDPSQLASVFDDELRRSTSLAGSAATVDLDLGPGVEGIEVLGWASTRTDTGWRVSLGDLPSGGTRRIVARVQVTAGAAKAFEAATATVHWTSSADVRETATASTLVEVTESVARADASVDARIEGESNWIYGNAFARRSASAYAQGDSEAASAMLEQSVERLKVSAERGLAKAKRRIAEVETQDRIQASAAPSSSSGRMNAKMAQQLSSLGYVD